MFELADGGDGKPSVQGREVNRVCLYWSVVVINDCVFILETSLLCSYI